MKRVVVLVIIAAAVFSFAAPAFAFWGELKTTAQALAGETGVQDGVNALKERISDSVPVISDWLDALIRFLQIYLGDVLNWLPS